MIPIHVALVPHYDDEYVNADSIQKVASALQLQLTRDFTPIWGIPAVVSAFQSLDDVPPACMPLVIVKPGTLHPRAHAFHITDGGEPIALVEGGPQWSLAASHELLEIICDPEGKRRVPGTSVVDLLMASEEPMEFVLGGDKYPTPQGPVAYLLEICDPCQAAEFAYTVNGIVVSDFVTPGYYAPSETERGGYSFTGRVEKPLQIPRGGYVSWYTSIEQAPIWQATNEDGTTVRVGPLAVPAPSFSRHRVDYFTDHVSAGNPVAPPRDEGAEEGGSARDTNGNTWGDEVNRVLAGYQADRKWQVSPVELLNEVENLLKTPDYWKKCADNPNALVDELARKGLVPQGSAYPGWRLPSRKVFEGVRDWLKRRIEMSSDPVTGGVATTMMKGANPWPPPPPPPSPPGGN